MRLARSLIASDTCKQTCFRPGKIVEQVYWVKNSVKLETELMQAGLAQLGAYSCFKIGAELLQRVPRVKFCTTTCTYLHDLHAAVMLAAEGKVSCLMARFIPQWGCTSSSIAVLNLRACHTAKTEPCLMLVQSSGVSIQFKRVLKPDNICLRVL